MTESRPENTGGAQSYPNQPNEQFAQPVHQTGVDANANGANPVSANPVEVEGPENVGTGVLFALLGALPGILVSSLFSLTGRMWSITVFLTVFGVVYGYVKGSGGKLKKGMVPVILIALLGIILSWLGAEWISLRQEAKGTELEGNAVGGLFELLRMYPEARGEVIGILVKNFLFFLLFGAVGTYLALRGATKPDTGDDFEIGTQDEVRSA